MKDFVSRHKMIDIKPKQKKYSFKGNVWKYKGPAGWHFVTLHKALAKRIRKRHGLSEEGWGRLNTTVKVGRTKWVTAIWYDTKTDSYILPIKAAVRKAEDVCDGGLVVVILYLQIEDKRYGMWARHV